REKLALPFVLHREIDESVDVRSAFAAGRAKLVPCDDARAALDRRCKAARLGKKRVDLEAIFRRLELMKDEKCIQEEGRLEESRRTRLHQALHEDDALGRALGFKRFGRGRHRRRPGRFDLEEKVAVRVSMPLDQGDVARTPEAVLGRGAWRKIAKLPKAAFAALFADRSQQVFDRTFDR